MNLFIDTNVFLSFYHFTSDDLEELKKLVALLRENQIQLLLTEQVKMEFRRNRENKIDDALKGLKEQRFDLKYPQLCKGYSEYRRLCQFQQRSKETHAKLMKRISHDASQRKLKADLTIHQLFKYANTIPTDDVLLHRAKMRCEIGNPPGKSGSLGDAVNWEALLSTVTNGETLHFITDDKDYCSPLDENSFDSFLLDEWRQAKNSQLVFYRKLGVFLKEKFPKIKLASEIQTQKEIAINALVHSGRWADTRAAIQELASYSDFTPAQRNTLVEAASANTQIRWIIDEDEIKDFFLRLIEGHKGQVGQGELERLEQLLG